MFSKGVKQAVELECQTHPLLETGDLIKLVYQCAMGCGHMVTDDEQNIIMRVRDEQNGPSDKEEQLLFMMCDYARLNLAPAAAQGLSPTTIGRLFALSGRIPPSPDRLHEGLEVLCAMARQGLVPKDAGDVEDSVAQYRASGCPARSHTQRYRDLYHPAYRVIWGGYAGLLPLLIAIDRALDIRGRAVVAIDGRCAAGKSTLADILGMVYKAAVVHADDFFLRPEQRTPQRLAAPGGNIDYERLGDEVISHLGEDRIIYRPYNCHTQSLCDPVSLSSAPVTVVEGSYCLHPHLGSYYDVAVFMDISPIKQLARLAKRSPSLLLRFKQEWIPMEEEYHREFDIRARCGITLFADELDLLPQSAKQ